MRDEVRGLDRTWLPSGTRFLKIHHYADPNKGPDWLAKVQKQMSDTPLEFRREILMDDTVFDGQPVFGGYRDEFHCPEKYHEKGIPILPNSIYFGGWDCGQALTPAFVLLQVTAMPFQIHVLAECISPGDESMNEFAPRVFDTLLNVIPGHYEEVNHFGDSTVTTRSGANKASARDEARKHGFNIRPVSNVWEPRYSAVGWLLSRRIDERTPGFMIDAKRCPVLRMGFKGAYKWEFSARGDQAGPGAVRMNPLKNSYSHVHDALQYPAIKIRTMVEGTGARLQE